jgi:hypothetical protein
MNEFKTYTVSSLEGERRKNEEKRKGGTFV